MYMPPGFSTVTPYFFVREAEKFIDFLVSAFDGVETHRSENPGGGIANAQVRIGTSMLMVGEAPERYGQMASSYYLYVADADAALKKALESGATLEMEVTDMPYGDRQGGVKDPFGNVWWLSQRLVEEPYSP